LNKVVDEFDGKIHFIEIDIDKDRDVAETAGVTGTPTIQFFKNKELLNEIKGIRPKSQYRQLIESHL
jgi:thioredoxin reductase (NADPH)